MTSLNIALKSEIARVSRKEMKEELLALRKATASNRAEIAALKRDLRALRSLVKANERTMNKLVPAPQPKPAVNSVKRHSFDFQSLAEKRAKLGLSQSEMAKLLEASPLSVYKWESGKVQPLAAPLARIAAIQKIGKREAVARLAS